MTTTTTKTAPTLKKQAAVKYPDSAKYWHQLKPHPGTVYEDPDDLTRRLENFVFVAAKQGREVNLYVKTRSLLGTKDFEVTELKPGALQVDKKPIINRYTFELYTHSLRIIAADMKDRDRIYTFLSNPGTKDAAVIVSAQHILSWPPLALAIHRLNAAGKTAAAGSTQRQLPPQSLEKKSIFAKTAAGEPMHRIRMFLSTDNREDVEKLRALLPHEQARWYWKWSSQKALLKVLNRKVIGRYSPFQDLWEEIANQWLGYNIVRSTGLNRTELTTLVQLPENPDKYGLTFGKTATFNYGFGSKKPEESTTDK